MYGIDLVVFYGLVVVSGNILRFGFLYLLLILMLLLLVKGGIIDSYLIRV